MQIAVAAPQIATIGPVIPTFPALARLAWTSLNDAASRVSANPYGAPFNPQIARERAVTATHQLDAMIYLRSPEPAALEQARLAASLVQDGLVDLDRALENGEDGTLDPSIAAARRGFIAARDAAGRALMIHERDPRLDDLA